MNSSSGNESNLKGSTSPSIEPKKSARLAEKRKLREEAGTPVSEDDFYFTPFTKSANSCNKSGVTSSRQSTPSPSPAKEKAPRASSPFTTIPNHRTSSPVPTSSRRSPVTCLTSPFKSLAILKTASKHCAGQPASSSGFVAVSSNSSAATPTPVMEHEGKPPIKMSEKQQIALGMGIANEKNLPAEESWADGLESEDICDIDDELKQIKNPKFMTARQKAILVKKDIKDSPAYLEEQERRIECVETARPAVTVEMIKRRAQKSERRRLQAKEKKEKDKKETIDRLLNLKKQHVKPVKPSPTKPKRRESDLKIIYINRLDSVTLTFPPGVEYPLRKTAVVPIPPLRVTCAVQGCTNPKKYSCSKTRVPLCSLECYKKNLEALPVEDSTEITDGESVSNKELKIPTF